MQKETWKKTVVIGALALAGLGSVRAETSPREYAVLLSASLVASPPSITLSWAPSTLAASYVVSRKEPGATSFVELATLPADALTFSDAGVVPGQVYEYEVRRHTTQGFDAYGYLASGQEIPLVEQRGKVILVVDQSVAGALVSELRRFESDLLGDGWTVLRHEVDRGASPVSVRQRLQADYNADPANVRAVILFGHVPVPYSGDIRPDGHGDHQGAWSADVFYADLDGTWTDASVTSTRAQTVRNHNRPGDGKWDQGDIPSPLEVAVGRIDLSNLPCFDPLTEVDLLRQYLDKNHNFRFNRLAVLRRGLICDNFGETGREAFASTGWRNFSGFFGADQVYEAPFDGYFSTVGRQSYLWSYGCGGGAFDFCNGIGGPGDFGTTDVQSVFTLFLGSYFGDFDAPNDFMRAVLGSKNYTLTSGWGGRPHWYLHHMALGGTLGESFRLTGNNGFSQHYKAQVNRVPKGVHLALLGDPTLHMHVVAPATDLNGAFTPSLALQWHAATDPEVVGYHVYRNDGTNANFRRLSGPVPLAGTTFADASLAGTALYMVRAVKLEKTPSGSYWNLSQARFVLADAVAGTVTPVDNPEPLVPAPVEEGPPPDVTEPQGPSEEDIRRYGVEFYGDYFYPPAPSQFEAETLSATAVILSWDYPPGAARGFRLERRRVGELEYSPLLTLAGSSTNHVDTGLSPGTEYLYRLQAFTSGYPSRWSPERSALTESGSGGPLSPGPLRLVISGSQGQQVQIESSTNLTHWSERVSLTLLQPQFTWSIPQESGHGFFRTRLTQTNHPATPVTLTLSLTPP